MIDHSIQTSVRIADMIYEVFPTAIRKGDFIYIGTTSQTQGWILHISVDRDEFVALLRSVLPILKRYGVPAKIVRDDLLVLPYNSGSFGEFKIGKIITLYPDDDMAIVPFVEELLQVTKGVNGPVAWGDFPLGNCVYTRYGSFQTAVFTDEYEYRHRQILDGCGNLYYDRYEIPPKIPGGIEIPFKPFIERLPKPAKTLIFNKRYTPTQRLKEDVKGDVWKAWTVNRLFLPKYCVIKQGRKGAVPDMHGRDARDRVKWQFEISAHIGLKTALPKMIDYFEDERTAYLVLEFIRGIDYSVKVYQLSGEKYWFDLAEGVKKEILGYLIKIGEQIAILHENKYIHRDITASNFMVSKRGRVHMIDVELMFNLIAAGPNEPFTLGTYGYMSPQQRNEVRPSFADDSYSFGVLMLVSMIGGIDPVNLLDYEAVETRLKLEFLLRDRLMIDLISSCLSPDPAKRPDISSILGRLRDRVAGSGHLTGTLSVSVGREVIDDTIMTGLNSLCSPLVSTDGIWYSFVKHSYDDEVYPRKNKHVFSALHRGVCGPLYLLSVALGLQYSISNVEEYVREGVDYVGHTVAGNIENLDASLHFGTAGMALTMARLIKSGVLSSDAVPVDWLKDCLDRPAVWPDMVYGSAGQGLAALACRGVLENDVINAIVFRHAGQLMESQEADGSWVRSKTADGKPEIVVGFGYGMAGIIYYLLEVGSRYLDKKAMEGALRGLRYLSDIKLEENGAYCWRNNNLTSAKGKWWCHGAPGIALSFLKGYEVTWDKQYKEIAEKALLVHPPKAYILNLSQCHGLSGLGEIYLEAFRVTGSQQWMDRAAWIAELLCAVKFIKPDGKIYWLVEQLQFPTADFMIGNAGVLHFLLHFRHPESVGFPLLSDCYR